MIDDKTRAEMIDYYQKGRAIQDIARVYRYPVEAVLDVLGMNDLNSVTSQGDLIDASELGPGGQMNYYQQFPVKFTTD